MMNEKDEPKQKPLVLFVDDVPDIRDLIEIGMRRFEAPFEAAFAEDVEGAMRLIREREPAAVVLDVNLAGETGMTIAAHLHEFYPQVAKAALTAYDRSQTHATAGEYGMEVWTKPMNMTEIVANVTRLLEARESAGHGGGIIGAAPHIIRALAAGLGLLHIHSAPRWH